MLFTIKSIRKTTSNVNRKIELENQKRASEVIRNLKAEIKKTAKKGNSDYRWKITESSVSELVQKYFKTKGFRCYECKYDMYATNKYLVIAW